MNMKDEREVVFAKKVLMRDAVCLDPDGEFFDAVNEFVEDVLYTPDRREKVFNFIQEKHDTFLYFINAVRMACVRLNVHDYERTQDEFIALFNEAVYVCTRMMDDIPTVQK